MNCCKSKFKCGEHVWFLFRDKTRSFLWPDKYRITSIETQIVKSTNDSETIDFFYCLETISEEWREYTGTRQEDLFTRKSDAIKEMKKHNRWIKKKRGEA
jgi:hypothetical protein